jgi:anaerobic selenocysteine-containing dehydrogenase
MNRHSTATSCLEIILLAVCGNIGVPGGNIFPGAVMPLGSHSDETRPGTWRTMATGFPAIMGVFPPNVMPEEIMSGHPERLRAVLCAGANPLRSYADTTAYEKAFAKLDLLVTCELSMTETARLSHYVLPARSGYESWDASFFAWTFPGIYFQMRPPVLPPEGKRLELAQIFTLLADRLGLTPAIPAYLEEAAAKDRRAFGKALMRYVSEEPRAGDMMPFVLAGTLGKELGSANLAALWGMLQTMPAAFRENAARAGFSPGPSLGEELFQAVLDHPEGLWVGECDPHRNLDLLQTEDKKLHIDYPEVRDWIEGITPEAEDKALAEKSEWPFILVAGRHMDMNANTLMRNPDWNRGKRACTLAMHPEDAERAGLKDGRMVRVVTEAGEETLELEVTRATRPGMVIIPHGFGLEYDGRVYGANVNRLTSAAHRDPLAGTPLHRYVPCRVEAA